MAFLDASISTIGLWFHDWSIFRIKKNRRTHQNTTNLFICQKQTDNPKWLILSTHLTDMCTNITEKVRKSNIRNSRNLKITAIFFITPHILNIAFIYIEYSTYEIQGGE